MKKIAVFFSNPDPMGHPFSALDYWESYTEFTQVAKNYGAQLYIVRTQTSYKGSGVFSNSWIIENGELKQTGEVKIDVVYNKSRFISDGIPTFNYQPVVDICLDKWRMYQELQELCPTTFLAQTPEQLLKILPNIQTDKVVFKPQKGGEGVGVKIENKEYFTAYIHQLQFPSVVSEFLDTSVGVAGIVEGLHDFRVAIFDGDILYSYYRTPPQGSYLANVSKGGKFEMIDTTRIPEEVVKIVTQIDSRLTSCKHRFYSVDFGFTKDGPKIIEMNSELGLLPNKDHPVFATLKEKLIQAFLDM